MLNQRFFAPSGLSLTARLEQPVEPGQARLFWDPAAGKWSNDPAARLDLLPDPTLPGCYLLQVPTSLTASWPDRTYHATVLTAAGAIAGGGPVPMAGGDDGGAVQPSVDLPWSDGRTIHFRGAYARPATPAT